jgi:hypothetical protein
MPMHRRSRRPFAWGTLLVALALFAALALPAGAQTRREHAIPTCFDRIRGAETPQKADELTIVIDQTALLDERLRMIVLENVDRLIRPGTQVSVAAFSGYMPGRYLDILVSGRVEAPISGRERDFVPKRDLRESDQCLSEQLEFARRLVATTIRKAFAASDPGLPNSEILAALRGLGSRRGDPGGPSERMLIVVSDMLENSPLTSFYRANRPRVIDPDAELHRAIAAGMTANFHGERVFVIGAGFEPGGTPEAHAAPDSRAVQRLEEFWRRWFQVSGAELVDFAKPAPLEEITWERKLPR